MQVLPSVNVRRLFELTGVDIVIGGVMTPRERGVAFTEPDALDQYAETLTEAAVLAHKHHPTDEMPSPTR